MSSRTALVLALGFVLATFIYMWNVYGQFPAEVPMQWDLNDQPTWFASRGVFFGWFITGVLVLTLIFTVFIPQREPALSFVGPVCAGILLLLFHTVYQQVSPNPFFHLRISTATWIVLTAIFVVIPFAVIAVRRARLRTPAGMP